jgi:hypothetical protein
VRAVRPASCDGNVAGPAVLSRSIAVADGHDLVTIHKIDDLRDRDVGANCWET